MPTEMEMLAQMRARNAAKRPAPSPAAPPPATGGAALLAQMRARHAATSAAPPAPAPSPTAPPPVPVPRAVVASPPAPPPTSASARVVTLDALAALPPRTNAPGPRPPTGSRGAAPKILVCRGVDCAGLGSAAALTEIEELCAHLRATTAPGDPLRGLEVDTTACTLQCALAPTVSTVGRAGSDSHKQVNNARRCGDIVRGVAARLGAAAQERDGPMQSRAAGMRFRALKLLGRTLDGAAQDVGRALLEASIVAEKRAARGRPALLARAEAREARLSHGCLPLHQTPEDLVSNL